MRFLLLEDAADGLLDLALRAQALGHSVRYFNSKYDAVKHPTGKGLVERVTDWRPSMRWCDLAVVGGNGKWLQELDRWRDAGVRIIGGCEPVAKLELDRLAGMKAFERMKIPLAPYRHCATLRDAMQYVAERGEGCAVKLCGDVTDKSTSIVGKTAEEVLWRLQRWQKQGKSIPAGLVVQDRVEGVEFGTAGWIGPDGFARGFEETWEGKRAFAGDLGPNTGESHSALRFVEKSKIAEKLLAPFEDYLVSTGYTGNISVNAMVTDDGEPIPLEWTCRLGWPSTNLELALHEDPIDFLCGLAEGDPPDTRKLDTLALGIVLSIPPYPFPFERADETVGIPIWGVTPAIEENMHWCMVMADKGELATSGTYIGVSVGTGETVVRARDEALRVLNRLTIPASPYWRVDAGARLRRGLPKLQENGFAIGIDYA